MELSEPEKRLVKVLQGTLPLDSLEPYKAAAESAGLSEAEVLATLGTWLESGVVRRVGAVIAHRRAGKTINVMTAWNCAGDGQLERAVRELVALPEVSHCYERPRLAEWPYNLYAMIHVDDESRLMEIVAKVTRASGVNDYRLLPSTREFKKQSPKYY